MVSIPGPMPAPAEFQYSMTDESPEGPSPGRSGRKRRPRRRRRSEGDTPRENGTAPETEQVSGTRAENSATPEMRQPEAEQAAGSPSEGTEPEKRPRRRRSRSGGRGPSDTSARPDDTASRTRAAAPESRTAPDAADDDLDSDGPDEPPAPRAGKPIIGIPVEDCAFAEFELRADLLAGIAELGYRTPSPIQAKSLPHALDERDVLGQARTGTGKTAAFLVPALQLLSEGPGIRVLVVVPTRELAMQVAEEARRLSIHMKDVRSLAVYGGDSMKRQLDELKRDPAIVAATPGRLLDHLGRGTIRFGKLDMLVLDEADRMFDLGFRDDIAKIMRNAPERRQTMLFSATLSGEVLDLSARYMNDPVQVFLEPDKMTVDEVDQSVFQVDQPYKTKLLIEVLDREQPELSIIFTRTKIGADKLAMRLQKRGLKAQELHSGLHQKKRESILADFRKGTIPYLIATDVAARGIDIPDVSHVINYDIPENPEDYVHRIGRTARMGKSGRAVSFVTSEDGPFLTAIEKLINQEVPVEFYEGIKTKDDAPEQVEADKPKGPTYTRTLQGHIRKRTRR